MTWTETSSKIKIGDSVCYRTSHLFAQGMLRTSLAHLSGKVTAIEDGNALITWDAPHDQPSVPISQLSKMSERGILE